MIKEKYRNNIAYLIKKKDVLLSDTDETPTYSQQCVQFRCNIVSKSSSLYNAGANLSDVSNSKYLLTTTQLDFEEYDHVSFTNLPRNDAEQNDLNTIIAIAKTPYMEDSNRYRVNQLWEYKLNIT